MKYLMILIELISFEFINFYRCFKNRMTQEYSCQSRILSAANTLGKAKRRDEMDAIANLSHKLYFNGIS
jgi:hypothetical protein